LLRCCTLSACLSFPTSAGDDDAGQGSGHCVGRGAARLLLAGAVQAALDRHRGRGAVPGL
jgi:hypothetical protein